jgi:hypothetical protein
MWKRSRTCSGDHFPERIPPHRKDAITTGLRQVRCQDGNCFRADGNVALLVLMSGLVLAWPIVPAKRIRAVDFRRGDSDHFAGPHASQPCDPDSIGPDRRQFVQNSVDISVVGGSDLVIILDTHVSRLDSGNPANSTDVISIDWLVNHCAFVTPANHGNRSVDVLPGPAPLDQFLLQFDQQARTRFARGQLAVPLDHWTQTSAYNMVLTSLRSIGTNVGPLGVSEQLHDDFLDLDHFALRSVLERHRLRWFALWRRLRLGV